MTHLLRPVDALPNIYKRTPFTKCILYIYAHKGEECVDFYVFLAKASINNCGFCLVCCRVSFGSSKGSMVETLVYESPLQEEPEESAALLPYDSDEADK